MDLPRGPRNYDWPVRYQLRADRDLSTGGVDDSSISHDPSTWRVTGTLPAFDVVGLAGSMREGGWVLLSTDLVSVDAQGDRRTDALMIEFRAGQSSVALARRPVPVVKGRTGRVLSIPPGTERISIAICPLADQVTASHVTLRPLSRAAAATLMATDVAASNSTERAKASSLVRTLRQTVSDHGARAAIIDIAARYDAIQNERSQLVADYEMWRNRHQTLSREDAKRLLDRCGQLPGGGPTISVVMPVHDPEPRWLQAAVNSVLSQTYHRWQLCIVNDASTNPAIAELLDGFARDDDRILVHHRTENGHIAAATNDGLGMATSEYVSFLDHDDELAPFALAAVALHAADNDVIYTDEDKIDDVGRHYDPHFKPSWNPELLLGQNYISHLTVIRRSLVDEVGGLRTGFDGSQDHDLVLRVTASTTPQRICHVPLIAYHWRAIAGSTALAPNEKTYTEAASIRALEDRLGEGWSVERADAPTGYRSVPPLDETPLVSIVIATRDRLELLRQCVESLDKTTYPDYEIIIVDNDSAEAETLEWLDSFADRDRRRVVAAPGSFNFSAVNNAGVAASMGSMVLLLNNDTEVLDPDWLTTMVRWCSQPGIGAVGAKLLYPNNTIQHAGIVLGLGGLAGHGQLGEPRESTGYFNRLKLTHEVGAVTAACLLTKRATWDWVGGLDEELAVAFNDVDYCLKVAHDAGERILWCADAVLYHHESASRGAEDDPAKIARWYSEVDLTLDRWSEVLDHDPAYNPNLSIDGTSFTLASAPRVRPPWAESDAEVN